MVHLHYGHGLEGYLVGLTRLSEPTFFLPIYLPTYLLNRGLSIYLPMGYLAMGYYVSTYL